MKKMEGEEGRHDQVQSGLKGGLKKLFCTFYKKVKLK